LKTSPLLRLNKILCFFSYYGIDFETKGTKPASMKKLFLILLVATGSIISKPRPRKSALALILVPNPHGDLLDMIMLNIIICGYRNVLLCTAPSVRLSE
jgi:hypothetical protein